MSDMMEGKHFIVTVHDKLNNKQLEWTTYMESVDEIKRALDPMKDFKFISARDVNA